MMTPLRSIIATFQPSGSLSGERRPLERNGAAGNAQDQRSERAAKEGKRTPKTLCPDTAPVTSPETTTSPVSRARCALSVSPARVGGAPNSRRVDRRTLNSESSA